MKTPENIGFVSTRFAGTDGVSLEAAKWAEVLWQDQHVSYWYGGVLDRDPAMSMCVPEAFFGHSENRWINEQLWNCTSRSQKASRRIRELAEYLKDHGFYWERQRFQISAVGDYLEMAFPPRIPHLQHVMINQAAKDQLGWRKGISGMLIPNVLDYDNPPDPVDDYAADVREELGLVPGDLLILQPTRVIPRKGIERAIHLLRRVEDPRCKLVVSHAAGDEGLGYSEEMRELAQDEGVELILFGGRVADCRQLNEDGHKIYVLEDLYPHADLVTFPSLYEGFGNALLEAIYFRKPLVIGNYSVYSRDIASKGISLPTIEGFIDRALVAETRRVLEDPDYRERLVERNYQVAQRYFSYRVLWDSLRLIIANIRNLTE